MAGTLGGPGKTGGHRLDLDTSGAYVVDDEPEPDPHYYIEDFEDGTLTSSTGRIDRHPLLVDDEVVPPLVPGSARGGPKTMSPGFHSDGHVVPVPASEEAATLTRGSASAGVSEPGRRAEDDYNLVATPINSDAIGRSGEADTPSVDAAGQVRLRPPGLGVGEEGDPSFTVNASSPPAVAYSVVPEGGQGADLMATEIDTAPALTSKNEGVPGYDRGVRVVVPEAQVYDPTSSGEHDESPPLKAGGRQQNESKGIGQDNVPVVVLEDVPVSGMRQSPDGQLLLTDESPPVHHAGQVGHNTPMVVSGVDTQNQLDTGDVSPTLRTPRESSSGLDDATPAVVVGEMEGLRVNAAGQLYSTGDESAPLRDADGAGTPMVFESRIARNGRGAPEDVVPPLKAESGTTGKGDSAPMVMIADAVNVDLANDSGGQLTVSEGEANPLTSRGDRSAVAYTKRHGAASADDDEKWDEAEHARTLSGFNASEVRATDIIVEPDDEPVGALQSGRTERGHGTAGVNDQAVDAGHIVAVLDTFTQAEVAAILGDDAEAAEADAGTLLRELREAVGAEAFAEWAARVTPALLSQALLRPCVHGCGVHGQEEGDPVCAALPAGGAEDRRPWPVRALRAAEEAGREAATDGRASQGPQPAEQRAGELRAALSTLPQPRAQAAWLLLGLRQTDEGARLLREALPAVQEVRGPADREGESALAAEAGRSVKGGRGPTGAAVRRLTPT